MPQILNINNIPPQFIENQKFASGVKTLYMGFAGGSEKLYVNIDYVKPGEISTNYHSHSFQEEFFLVIKGKGKLRLNNRELEVKEGDFFSKPAGKEIAHQFINTGKEVMEILDCGTVEKNDYVHYPDKGKTVKGLDFEKLVEEAKAGKED